ncbi:MAG: hypothetical protein VST70_07090 [Nitrospirota bacterium]|nr:hypothetical protein [Nitrospirota bacterium]
MSVPSGGAERVRSEPGAFGTGLFVTPVSRHLEEMSGGFLRGNRIEDVPGLDIGRTTFPAEEGLDIVPAVSARLLRKAGTGGDGENTEKAAQVAS